MCFFCLFSCAGLNLQVLLHGHSPWLQQSQQPLAHAHSKRNWQHQWHDPPATVLHHKVKEGIHRFVSFRFVSHSMCTKKFKISKNPCVCVRSGAHKVRLVRTTHPQYYNAILFCSTLKFFVRPKRIIFGPRIDSNLQYITMNSTMNSFFWRLTKFFCHFCFSVTCNQ